MTDVPTTTGTPSEPPAADGPRRRLAPFVAIAVALVLVGFVVVLATSKGGTTDSARTPLIGRPAPVVQTATIDGTPFDLATRRGSWVVLNFFATWCPPCRAEIPAIERLHTQYGSKGLTVLAVSLDEGGWDEVKSFATEHKISYTVLRGTEDVSAKYMVRLIPSMFLIDRQGNIMKQYMGGGNVEAVEQEIKALL